MRKRIYLPREVCWRTHPPAIADTISHTVLEAIRSAAMGLSGDSIEIIIRDNLEMPVQSIAGKQERLMEERME